MSDLTLPIIGLTSLAGYFFSKKVEKSPEIKANDNKINIEKPNGTNIYTSDAVNSVNAEMLERSMQNYKRSENPSETGVLPPLFNTYSVIGNDHFFDKGAPTTTLSEVNDINRYANIKAPEPPIANRPMFNKIEFGGKPLSQEIAQFDQKIIDSDVSLLTGLPLDTQHNNMIPFFGSNRKQNVETFNNLSVLDKHTGNTSVFRHKREVDAMFAPQQENIYGNPVFTTQVNESRYIPSLYKQNEKPFMEERVSATIAGIYENNIRPQYKDVNDLRPGNKPKETYKGDIIAGQRGSVRGTQSDVKKQRPDTYYESGPERYFTTIGEFVAPKLAEDYSTNFKMTSRKDYNLEYYGGVRSDHLEQRPHVSSVDNSRELMGIVDSIMQEPKRENYANDWVRNVKRDTQDVHDYGRGGMVSYETERATTESNTHLLNAQKLEMGLKTVYRDAPRTTTKETTLLFDNRGNVKTTFDANITETVDNGMVNLNFKTTHKETLVDNKYIGGVDKKEGLGYLTNKYDARTTGKEIVSERSKYTGNAQGPSQNTLRDRYENAEIRDRQEIALSGERPPGPQYFQIGSGKNAYGEIKSTDNLLLKEQFDRRKPMNVNVVSKAIPDREQIGYVTRFNYDDDYMDTVTNDRLQPDLVLSQLDQNPYSLYGSANKRRVN